MLQKEAGGKRSELACPSVPSNTLLSRTREDDLCTNKPTWGSHWEKETQSVGIHGHLMTVLFLSFSCPFADFQSPPWEATFSTNQVILRKVCRSSRNSVCVHICDAAGGQETRSMYVLNLRRAGFSSGHLYQHIWLLSVSVLVTQSCLTFCDPMDWGPPGFLQARIPEWIAIPFSRVSSWPRDRTQVSLITGGFFTIWAWESFFPRRLWLDQWGQIWPHIDWCKWKCAFYLDPNKTNTQQEPKAAS